MGLRPSRASQELYDRSKLMGAVTLVILAVVIACGVFIFGYVNGTHNPAPRSFNVRTGYHWPSRHRIITIEDRTGAAEWIAAEQTAVRAWDRALAHHADVSLIWTDRSTIDGGCRFDGTNVTVCRRDHLQTFNGQPSQAVYYPLVDSGTSHMTDAYIELDASREGRWSAGVKLSIVSHELCHVLGIEERTGTASHDSACTNDVGVYPPGPDAEDVRIIQGIYAHTDS